MADGSRKKVADGLAAKAALEAARSAARRAVADVTSSDEERARKEAERAALARRKRSRLILYGVAGLLVVLGAIGLIVSYWQWLLLLGLLGLAALYGRHRWRRRLRAKKEQRGARAAPRLAAGRGEPRPALDDEIDKELEGARRAAARAEARAEEQQAIEDELAELKRRLDE